MKNDHSTKIELPVRQLRHHNQILRLPFKAGLKRQDRINGRVAFVEACHTGDKSEWFQYFEQVRNIIEMIIEMIDDILYMEISIQNCCRTKKWTCGQNRCHTIQILDLWVIFLVKRFSIFFFCLQKSLLCAVSDGFFPFRDSIDVMAKSHVQWVMHPGGSIADETIKLAASSYRMGLIESHVRLFVH